MLPATLRHVTTAPSSARPPAHTRTNSTVAGSSRSDRAAVGEERLEAAPHQRRDDELGPAMTTTPVTPSK